MLWVDKYRPSSPEDLKGHECLRTTIEGLTLDNVPNLLLVGPPGSGKSSAVNVLSNILFGSNWKKYVLAINASDSRNIKVVRETITSFLETDKSVATFLGAKLLKLVILEEADALTSDAQSCLRTMMEKYHDRSRFVLLVNYVQLLTPAIQSRCCLWPIPPLADSSVAQHLLYIAKKEEFGLSTLIAEEIASLVKGDMRKAISVLQALKACRSDDNSDLDVIQTLLRKPGKATEIQLHDIFKNDAHSQQTLISQLWYCFEQTAGGSCSIDAFLLKVLVVCYDEELEGISTHSMLDLIRFSHQACNAKLLMNAVSAIIANAIFHD